MEDWNTAAERMSKVTDRLGKPIDEGIFESVVALNVLGFLTVQSCEGHLDHGFPYPWVEISEYEYKHVIMPRIWEIKDDATKVQELTGLRSKGNMLELEVRSRLRKYLGEFYANRKADHDRILVVIRRGGLRLQSNGAVFSELAASEERF